MSDTDTDSDRDGTRPFVSTSKPRTRTPKSKPQTLKRQNKFKRKRRALCIGIVAAAIVLTLVLLCLTIFTSEENEYSVENAARNHSRANSTRKSVLLWQWFVPQYKSTSDCEIFDGRWLSAEELRNHAPFDAVIFNATAYKTHPLPIPRLPQQYYIYALDRPLTPAFQARYNVSELAEFFNLTYSYKLDSDILLLTHAIDRYKYPEIHAPTQHPVWLESIADTKNAEWKLMPLNNTVDLLALTILDAPCDRIRNEVVKAIANYTLLHIYGDCGQLQCPYGCPFLPYHFNGPAYKFYFAFEAELCTDYVSSYFYQALMEGIVPVVFGGADYTRFAPPHSYIQAEDFTSPQELVKYLNFLHQNRDEYLKYFIWRKPYTIRSKTVDFSVICDFLREEANSVRSNFNAWWTNNQCRNHTNLL